MTPPPAHLGWVVWHVLAGHARQHRLRTLVQAVAIALGVALGYAVNLINGSALNEFAAAVRTVSGEADASITARAGFDEALFARVLADPGVAFASPALEADVPVLGTGAARAPTLHVVGVDLLRAGVLSPSVVPALSADDDRDTLFNDGIFLSPAALEAFGVRRGDRVQLQVGAQVLSLPVTGTLPNARAGQLLGVMDLGFAQWRLQRLGVLTRIDLKLAPGTRVEQLAATLALPAGAVLAGAATEGARVSNVSRAYRVNLNVLALVALFTGAFLVLSLQAQATLARRSQLAFLRVVGVTAGELQGLLLVEALVLGVVGSALGLALGAAVATLALQVLGGDLGTGLFAGTQPTLRFTPGPAVGFFALGVLAALAGNWLPARDAAATPPAAALKSGAEEDALRPLGTPWPGLALLAAGGLLALAPPVGGLALGGYLAVVALLIGAIALSPHLAHAVFGPLARRLSLHEAGARRPMLLLAVTRLAQAPGFAAIGMAGIVASFALMIAMATMVASFRGSVDQWLTRVLPADLYARVAGIDTTAHFSAADLERLRSHPAVQRADFARFARVQLDPARSDVLLMVRPYDVAHPERELPLTGAGARWTPDQPPPVWVSEAMVDLYGARVGGTLELPLAGRQHRFFVAGVWRDYVRSAGAVAMRDADYQRITGDTVRTDAALWLRPGAVAATVAAELRPQLDAAATTEFNEPGAIRRLSLQIFDRSFAVTYALEVAAIVIGLVGIGATFSSQAIARTREFGMLRHLGLTRGQVLRLLAIEGLLVTALAVVVGLLTGLAISRVLIDVVNPQSFHWTMDFDAPRLLIGALMAALLAAATLTAVLAGRRAVSIDAVRAVREDW